jgi:hypothetical protein
MPPPPDIDVRSRSKLKSLALKLLEERTQLQRTAGALRNETAQLKAGPGQPDIKANVKQNGVEKASNGSIEGGPSARPHAREVDSS